MKKLVQPLLWLLLTGVCLETPAWAFLGMGHGKTTPSASPTDKNQATTSQSQTTQSKQTPSSGGDARRTDTQVEDSAEAIYNQGVDLFQTAQVQAEKGNLDGQKALLKQSIKLFEAALKKKPSLVEAQSNIGFAYLTLHQNRPAIKEFQKALEINANHLNTLNGLATAYALEDRLDDALKTFNRLTTLDPGNTQYFFNKGSVLQKAGHLSDSEAAYRQALRLNAKDQRSLFNLGTLFENQGKLSEARTFYAQAKDVAVDTPVGLEAIRRLETLDEGRKDASVKKIGS